tara:strand:- start:209 stop:376 length:168 start_codon:yes stop_codon:yes gene_type:complete
MKKLIAFIVCFVIWILYVVFLESQGISATNLGGAIPAVIFISVIYFVWNKITGSK